MARTIALRPRLLVGLAVCLLTAWPFPGTADDVNRVLALAEVGAPTLALRILDAEQPELAEDAEGWMRWERERIRIYRGSGDWAALARRLDNLPARLPPEFHRWAGNERALALLALGRGEEARRALLPLIWEGSVRGGSIREWRRLLIRSYLVDGAVEDAQRAVLRYRQDYGGEGSDELRLRARILLLADRPDAAAELLAGQGQASEALYLLAQLRSQALGAGRVMQRALKRIADPSTDAGLERRLWAVVAEAAARAEDHPTRAKALEYLLAEPAGDVFGEGLFDVGVEHLWAAYRAYASRIGNEAQYLVGDERPWLEAARAAAGPLPVRARSLYASLLDQAVDPAIRRQAVDGLLASLERRKHGDVLLKRLFLEAPHYEDSEDIPLAVRHRLVDLALRESDIDLASRLMAGMMAPPTGTEDFDWHLRRARVLIMGGDAERGAEALGELAADAKLDRKRADRLLQVVFDLQTVEAHRAALEVFETVLRRTADVQLRREILYWMAESRRAQGRHADAAQLYLHSAMLPGVKTMDPWAQTARYQAATSLAAAGLLGDARRLYEDLLRVTEDGGRRAVLKRELQRLWLGQAPGEGVLAREPIAP